MNSEHLVTILRVQLLVTDVLLVVTDCMYTMYASSDINGIESVVGKTAECQVKNWILGLSMLLVGTLE
jgi:hypothetical protein